MECKEAGSLMHEYLDGELSGESVGALNRHLSGCPDCRSHMATLEEADAFIRFFPLNGTEAQVPAQMTERVMGALPRPRRRENAMRWLRRHPAASVAVVFVVVMLASFMSLWEKDSMLVVKGSDLDEVIIQGDHVIVPAGSTVNGNLLVENGTLQVDGTVAGNVTIVDGSYYMASTAMVAGQVEEIHQSIDYFWYRLKQFFTGFSR